MGIAIAMDMDKYGYYGGEREGLASYDHFFYIYYHRRNDSKI